MAAGSNTTDVQPRFGAFVTMTVGLLLFFGAVSRIGKVSEPADILSSSHANTSLQSRQRTLEEERQRTIAIIGGRSETVSEEPSREADIPPAEESQPEEEQIDEPEPGPQPDTRIRRYTLQPGDTLYRVAQKHFGENRGELWGRILEANPQLKPGEMRVGTVINIPDIDPDLSGSALR